MNMLTLADATPSTAANTGMDVFASWILTPTGATLTLLMIGLGIAGVVARGVRWVGIALKVALAMWVVWILGGILEAWGVPVREMIRQLGAYLPTLLNAAGAWLARMFEVAG